jgi:DNA-binding CsgD family transcriptional regulator/tetratricopeptide (TPR) repeat protein
MVVEAKSPIIVGRERELELIDAALAEAAGGRPRLIVVRGEAGIGKSRLVDEAAARARAAGSPLMLGACLDIGEGGLPYLPVGEALRGLLRTLDPARLDRALGSARVDLATLVPELAARPTTAGEKSERNGAGHPPTSIDRVRLFERFIGFLGRLGEEKPVLAVIEDVQWIDRSTQDLITFLVRNVTTEPLVAILTCRTDDLPPGSPVLAWLAELGRAPGAMRVGLDRLDRESVTRQVQAISGSLVDRDAIGRIWGRSEGNPLFVEELVALDDRDASSATPVSLIEILLARVASLDTVARRVLGAVAVAGRPVDERLLAPVLGLEESAVAASVREAIGRGVLVADLVDGRHRFRHELLREVVERDLLAGERLVLHERFATTLAAHPDLADPSPAGAASELALHWAAAGHPLDAFRAAIAAASASDGVHAFSEAHRYLEQALELESRLPESDRPAAEERFALRRRTADAADLAGDFDRATALLLEALQLIDGKADPTTAGLIQSRLGYLRWITGHGADALAAHELAVELVPAEPPTPERARVLGGLGGALMGAGRWADSRIVCEAAIACAAAAGSPSEESRARNMLGSDLVALGEIEAGLHELREARRIAAESGPPELLIVGHHNLALNLAAADVLEEALAEASAGREAARDAGLERRFGMDLAALVADVLFRLGRWDEAEVAIDEALALDQRAVGTTYLAAVRARLLAARGAVGAAEEALATIDRSSLDPDVAAFVGHARAEAALAAGRPADSVAAATEGLAGVAGLDDVVWSAPLVAVGLRAVAEAAEIARAESPRAGRDHAPASDLDAAGAQLADGIAALEARAVTRSSRAWLATARAERLRAAGTTPPTTWIEAAEAWDAVPDPWLAAYARFRAAESALRAEGVRADAAAPLRAAHEAAGLLRAAPLRDAIEALASRARIPLGSDGLAARVDAGGEATTRETPAPPPAKAARPHGLSEREIEVLALVAAGRTNGEIAERLFITRKTASVHVTHILDKLGVSNRVEAAMVAARLGLAADRNGDRDGD